MAFWRVNALRYNRRVRGGLLTVHAAHFRIIAFGAFAFHFPSKQSAVKRRLALVGAGVIADVLVVTLALTRIFPAAYDEAALVVSAEHFDAMVQPVTVEIHRSATCDCCGEHCDYLATAGFRVVEIMHDAADMSEVKRDFGVPRSLWSCYTSVVDGCAVEGHVPVDVIKRLLADRPKLSGVALSGMPAGSPEMTGK